jgi:dipeptidyl aminopeptidase/acylaminoacyl peptidase
MKRYRKVLIVVMVLIFGGILACTATGDGGGRPVVEILSPPSGSGVGAGEEVEVQFRAADEKAVVRVDLEVQEEVVDTQASPSAEGQPSFTGLLRWTPTTPGSYTLMVYAYNSERVGSTGVGIQIEVTEGTGGVEATPIRSGAGRIAYVSGRDGNPEIYVMNADGDGRTRLTNNTAYDWIPAWSPDGTRIAFVSDRDGNYEIYVMNADGGGRTRLTNNTAEEWIPAWSPDGTRIAFVSDRDGNGEIYVMNADGSGVTRLTNNAADDEDPAWSPDGTRIAL